MTTNETLYMNMLEEAVKHDLPKEYRRDLYVHDRKLLLEHPVRDVRTVGAWVLRTCGTDVMQYSPSKDQLQRFGDDEVRAYRVNEDGSLELYYNSSQVLSR